MASIKADLMSGTTRFQFINNDLLAEYLGTKGSGISYKDINPIHSWPKHFPKFSPLSILEIRILMFEAFDL